MGSGEAVLSAALQVLFDRLASREFINFFKGNEQIWRLLMMKLKMLICSAHALIGEAEQKQIDDDAVKQWVDELTDAAYEAWDSLDEIGIDALQQQNESSFINQVQGLVSYSLETVLKTSQDKIEMIIGKLEFLLAQRDFLGLGRNAPKRSPQELPPPPLAEYSSIYGRHTDKKTIIDHLLNDDNSGTKISVIPIVGMAGIGKTTLAQLAYNDEEVRRHFTLRAWINVSLLDQPHNVLSLTREILEAVTAGVKSHIKDYILQKELTEVLKDKKFLLVLDSVWKAGLSFWDVLKSTFETVAFGSRIIVTTRDESVYSDIRYDILPHHLKTLAYEDSWSLFAKHAFDDADSRVHSKLKAIGQKVVERCDGLPLALKAFAGLLHSKANLKDWENLLDGDFLPLLKRQREILLSLWFSYNYLSPELKRCFAYCAIFPKDYVFEKEPLIFFWMAQDLLQCQEGKTMEEVGEEYFQELISRSLFRPSSSNPLNIVTMHSLVHELATFVSGKFVSRLVDSVPLALQNKTRHFSCIEQNDIRKFEELGLQEDSCFRTFLLSRQTNAILQHKFTMPKGRRLRAVSLSGCQINKLTPIGMLKHIRYLNFSSSDIEELPDDICALYYLQTLVLLDCKRLTRLPANTTRLLNLRHLKVSGSCLKEMPPQMCNLINLYFLTDFVLAEHTGCSINELSELHHLHGGLKISGLQNVTGVNDVSKAGLKEKQHLDKLDFEWEVNADDAEDGREDFDKEILENLKPHPNVNELSITQYSGREFPNWVGKDSFVNIEVLSLVNCKKCCSLPPLGQLPSLRRLEIRGFDSLVMINDGFYSNGPPRVKPFPSLEILYFENMLEWQRWSFFEAGSSFGYPGAVFSHVKQLHLINCPKLNVDYALHFPSLETRQPSVQQLMRHLSRSLLSNTTPRMQFMRQHSFP